MKEPSPRTAHGTEDSADRRRASPARIMGRQNLNPRARASSLALAIPCMRSPLEDSTRNPAAGFDVDAAVVVVAAAASIAIARFFVYGRGGGRGSSPSRG